MSNSQHAIDVLLQPADNARLANLCGPLDEHLRQLERRLGVEINNRGNQFRLIGNPKSIQVAEEVLQTLYRETAKDVLNPDRVHLFLQESDTEKRLDQATDEDIVSIRTRRAVIRARGPNQKQYLQNMMACDLNFGVGPAGTGKSYLAVLSAVHALENDLVRRIVLVRPAVEAGERLGFLPGDLAQKIDPYLRPLYDALYELVGFDKVDRLIEKNVIEVAPLAYMRGRTLNESFVILDEAQNTTVEQMKMFLTRIGFNSKAVVTGDITQVDLPKQERSGLRHVTEVLKDIEGIRFTYFSTRDVVRHPLVQRIVQAYETFEQGNEDSVGGYPKG